MLIKMQQSTGLSLPQSLHCDIENIGTQTTYSNCWSERSACTMRRRMQWPLLTILTQIFGGEKHNKGSKRFKWSHFLGVP